MFLTHLDRIELFFLRLELKYRYYLFVVLILLSRYRNKENLVNFCFNFSLFVLLKLSVTKVGCPFGMGDVFVQ